MKVDSTDRSALWLPLLRRLTTATATWAIWKNADSALAGPGDIDAAATISEWDDVEQEFVRWAAALDLGLVVSCRHIPGGRNLIAVPEELSAFLELSIKHDKTYHGSSLFVVEDLAPLVEMDTRGFRRVRAGAEGVFKLVLNGAKWGLSLIHISEPTRLGMISY